jgi:hypothetical protein
LPDAPILHVFAQEQVAIRFRSGTQDHGIPYTELMCNCEVSSGQHGRSRSLKERKGLAPAENCRAGAGSRAASLADKNLKEFAECLYGQDYGGLGQTVHQLERQGFHGRPIDPLGVSENIGV